VAANLSRFAGGRLDIEIVMVDFDSLEPVGRARSRPRGPQAFVRRGGGQ